MLDSLVRVSRRVGGAADLLATEMRAVPVRHSLYEPAPLPAGRQARSTGAWGQAPNFTRALSRLPAVRCVKDRRNAATDATHPDTASLRIADAQGATPLA